MTSALIILTLWLLSPALAVGEETVERLIEQLPIQEAQRAADAAGSGINLMDTLRAMLSGDAFQSPDALAETAARFLRGLLPEAAPGLYGALLPMMLSAIVCQFIPRGGMGKAAMLACRFSLAGILIAAFQTQARIVQGALTRIESVADALTPILVSLLTITGGTRAASLITPMGAMGCSVIALGLRGAGLTLCALAAASAIAGNLGQRLKLKRLFSLIRSFTLWAVTTVLSAYLTLLTAGGLIAGSYDNFALRSARFAADSLLPVIGGEVAESMDVLMASAALVRNAAGITGLTLLLSVCVAPLFGLIVTMALCRAVCALTEPVADDAMVQMVDDFAGVISMLLIVTAAAAMLLILLIGATIRMGSKLTA